MDALLTKGNSIPQNERQGIIDLVLFYKDTNMVPVDVLEYFFKVYNQYLTTSPEDFFCGHCQAKVVRNLQRLVNLWESNLAISKSA